MICTWCTKEATEGGRAPLGVSGLKYIAGCDIHKNKIEKLKYIPMPPAEIDSMQRREAKEAAKK
jgi:hypothetical protein